MTLVLALVAVALAQEEEPNYDDLDMAERVLRSRLYLAAVEEEAIHREFRSYLSFDPKADRAARGRVTDKIRIESRVELTGTYDDNIFLTSTDETADFIAVAVGSFAALYEDDSVDVGLHYTLRERVYADNTQLSGPEHLAHGRVLWRMSSIEIQAWYSYSQAKDPTDAIVLQRPVDRRIEDTGASFAFPFSKCRFELSGRLTVIDIAQDIPGFFGYREWNVTATAAMDLVVRTEVFAEAGRTGDAFDQSVLDDYMVTFVATGVRGRPVQKLAVIAKVGWMWIDVDEASGSFDRRDEQGLLAHGGASWRLWETTLILAGVRREPVAAHQTGGAIRTQLDLSCQQWLAERVIGSAGVWWALGQDDGPGGDRTTYGVRIGVRYEMGRRFHATCDVEYRAGGNLKFETSYDNVRASIGLSMEW